MEVYCADWYEAYEDGVVAYSTSVEKLMEACSKHCSVELEWAEKDGQWFNTNGYMSYTIYKLELI